MLHEVRCVQCNRLLCKASPAGLVEVMCHHCKTLNRFPSLRTEQIVDRGNGKPSQQPLKRPGEVK